jgi:putative oxidoreductase
MLGALLFVHLKNGFFAHQNGYEYVLVLLVASVAVAMIGGGALSLRR